MASLYVYRQHLCGGTEENSGLFHDKRSAGRALNTRPPAHEAGLSTVWRVSNRRQERFCGLHTRGATKEILFGTADLTVMTRVIWRAWRRMSGEWCGGGVRVAGVAGVDTCRNGGSLEYEICFFGMESIWVFLENLVISYLNLKCTAFLGTRRSIKLSKQSCLPRCLSHYTIFL